MAAWNTYILVESVDEAASKVLDAGGRVVMDPFGVANAGRMAVITDPQGATFIASKFVPENKYLASPIRR